MKEPSSNRDKFVKNKTESTKASFRKSRSLMNKELAKRWRGCFRQRENNTGAGGM